VYRPYYAGLYYRPRWHYRHYHRHGHFRRHW
jgi:hypothetical protein